MSSSSSVAAPHEPLATRIWESPIGAIAICAGEGGLRVLTFADPGIGYRVSGNGDEGGTGFATNTARAIVDETQTQLAEYFAGRRRTFSLPLDLRGSEFQRRVWQELCCIDFGATISYRALATRIGRPSAVRAVGAANGANPISIIVPCHRVIGADGSLIGYGGGIERKRSLLELEREIACSGGLL